MKNKKYVITWLRRAESNLELAKAGKKSKKIFYEDLCFECQQTAEKALKAVLISIDKKFRKTHNIELLIKLLEAEGIKIPVIIAKAKQLSDYAVETRYPGDFSPVSNKEYKQALSIAEDVFRWAKIVLNLEKNTLFEK